MDWMPQAVRDGIIVILVVSGPVVLVAAAIGLLVGILQAATQVQEQTIGSALKILGVFLLIIVSGYWMFGYINQYTKRTLQTAFTFVPHQTKKVLSAKQANKFKTTLELPDYPEPLPLPENPEGSSVLGSKSVGSQDIRREPERELKYPPTQNSPSEENLYQESTEGYQEPIPLEE